MQEALGCYYGADGVGVEVEGEGVEGAGGVRVRQKGVGAVCWYGERELLRCGEGWWCGCEMAYTSVAL